MPVAPPPPGAPRTGTTGAATPAAPSLRGLTITILAVLWGLNAPLALLGAIGAVIGMEGAWRFVVPAFYLVTAGISGVMCWGLWTVKPWARMAQVVLSGVGMLVPFSCPFVVSLVSTILYMLRPAAGAIGVGIALSFMSAANQIPVR
jgi:hypothetical protein